MKSLSCVRLLATPWTAAHQAPLSMGFSRQEYWSGVPLPSPILLVPKSKLSFSCSILNLRKQKLFLLTLSEFYSFLCNLHLVHTFIISLAMLILVYLLIYNLLKGQPENSWTLGGKYCIVSNPSTYSGLHLPCFLQCVQQQHLSVNTLGQVTGTECLLEVCLLVASLQEQLGFQGYC